ncbi:MAG TPA: 50S ribosomal protein L11 methyltransferase, partial [Ureibacillus sp.]|nr:50S ribosomal protein L11 methyltransferase [Ureibacillus sp.]
MKWTELSVLTTNEAVEAISNIYHEAGASGVVIEDSTEMEKERVDQFGEIYALNPNDFPTSGVIVKAYL